MFLFFNDPEGPNLLVVIVMAGIVYVVSLGVYLFVPPTASLKRLVLTIFVQILLVMVFYFLGLRF